MAKTSDDAGPFGLLQIEVEDNEGKPLPFGKVAICMRNGGWLGSSNGFPMGAPALYSRERAERIVELWNAEIYNERAAQAAHSLSTREPK